MAGIDLVNLTILGGAALLLAGIFSSLVATRFGAPLLLVFLVVGMLAGVDGPGGFSFSDYGTTYLVGSIALAVVLFDGGLRTRLSTFRGVLAPSLILATVGVLVTAGIAGGAAWAVLDLSPLEALLLGAIVASTDAAAVFFLLRTGGLRLQSRVGSTLEIESGTNDPIAVFLVIVLTELLIAGESIPGWQVAIDLGLQGAIGGVAGLAGGLAFVAILNRVTMPGGLHPLFVVAGAVLLSTSTNALGGSGLLAVYIAGLVLANRPTRAYPAIVGFHDAATWLCQIVMFLVLGLLVTPSELVHYALPGLAIAVVLILVARPIAVWLCLSPFGYQRNEKLFISWVGLRGAVSIFLAAIPTLGGVPHADTFFNIAFFVVLVSLLVQGSTLTRAARWSQVALRNVVPNSSRVEIDIPGQTDQEIVGYHVAEESVILGLSRLPAWSRLLMVVRDGAVLDPTEAGPLHAGDYGYFLVPREKLPRLDTLFRESAEVKRRLGLAFGEFPLRPDTRVGEVAEFYGLDFGGADPGMTLADWMASQLPAGPALDSEVTLPGGAKIIVRRMEGSEIATLGLQLEPLVGSEPDEALIDRIAEETGDGSVRTRLLRRLRPGRPRAGA